MTKESKSSSIGDDYLSDSKIAEFLQKHKTEIKLGELQMVVSGKTKDSVADFYFGEKKLTLEPAAQDILRVFFDATDDEGLASKSIFVSSTILEVKTGMQLSSIQSQLSSIRQSFEAIGCPYQIISKRYRGYSLVW